MMIPVDFDEYLQKIFSGHKKHKYYDKAVELQREMAVHVSGDSPGDLINRQRPNEPDTIKEYREQIWEPVTKPEYGKIQAVINRIFNPRYYSITFEKPGTRIPDEADLETYMKEKYPYYRSYLVFIQQVLLPKMLEDPNAICCIKPLYVDKGEDFDEGMDLEDIQPVPQIYMSDKLIDFIPGELYVVDLTEYKSTDRQRIPRKILVITDENITEYEYTKKDGSKVGYIETLNYEHGLGTTPVFRLGGIITEDEYPYLYESFISAVVPHWNKACMLQSDLDAQVVLHAYLERWEYTSTDCTTCGGSGREPPPPGGYPSDYTPKSCHTCGGTGYVMRSPFQAITINPESVEPGGQLPIPPAGYIEKSIEILNFVDGKVDDYIKKGFKAVNMDIVNEVGEVQSGIAKTVDRQDLDAFLQNISNHLFDYIIPNIIEYTIGWLYVSNQTIGQVSDYEYTIIKPARFDVMSVQYLMDEFKQAREAKIDNTVLSGIQIGIVEKMFTGMDRQKLIASIRLNPLAGLSDDTIMSNSAIISEEDKYINVYINDLVSEAMEDGGFIKKTVKEQREIIREMARERLQQSKTQLIESGEGPDDTE